MKLSVILVSVNIAATLPLAISGAASADEATKGTSDWSKGNLSSIDPGVNQKNTSIRVGSRSFSQPADSSPKLRPFVAHRRLPTQHELDMQLIAQTAKMAAQPAAPVLRAQTATMAATPQPLTGQVSDVYQTMPESYSSSGLDAVSSYGSVGYVKQSSSRVVPGQVPVAPNQIRQFKSGKRTRYVPAQADLNPAAPLPTVAGQPLSLGQQMALQQRQELQMEEEEREQMRLQAQANMQAIQSQPHLNRFQPALVAPNQMPIEVQYQPPPLTPDEQAIIDRMVNQIGTGESPESEFTGLNTSSVGPGPAPFPLSLLPQNSLHELVKGAGHRPSTGSKVSSFGSWRGDRVASAPAAPYQGKYAYSGPATPAHTSTTSNAYKHTAPLHSHVLHSHSTSTHSAAHNTSIQSQSYEAARNNSMSQIRRLPPQDAKPTIYAPYARYSGTSAY